MFVCVCVCVCFASVAGRLAWEAHGSDVVVRIGATDVDLAMHLIETYHTKALHSASKFSLHRDAAYAIQECLKVCGITAESHATIVTAGSCRQPVGPRRCASADLRVP